MKKKLTLIFTAITFCLCGIIYLQADWLYKTYQINQKKLKEDANEALKVSLGVLEGENQAFIRQLIKSKLGIVDSIHVDYFGRDSLRITLQDKISELPKGSVTARIGFSIGHIAIQLPTRKIGKIKSLSPLDDNYYKLESIIRHLIQTNTSPPCSTSNLYTKEDSIKILKRFIEVLAIKNTHANPETVQLIFFCAEKPYLDLTQEKLKGVTGTEIYEYSSRGFERWAGNSKRYVGAYFHAPYELIIPGMIWPISLSFILILFTIFTFIVLLKIILNQKRLAEMKDDFINNMTHELKTPIATIAAAIEGMLSFNALQDKEKTERYLTTSSKELHRLDTLVTKILNIAAYERKEVELNISRINISKLINDIINVETLKAAKEVNFSFVKPDNMEEIEADPVHFRNSLANIIDNAIKYSNNPVEIAVRCWQDDNNVFFSIKDNGIGIPDLHTSRIFDKFYRIPTGNIHTVKGTGLGLSYTKYIIEQHGGNISVKSTLGKGSEFLISIPKYKEHYS